MLNLLLTTVRRNLNLSQEELARKLKVTTRTVSRWECETSQPTKTALSSIAYFLNNTPQRSYVISLPADVSKEFKRLCTKAGAKVNTEITYKRMAKAASFDCIDCGDTASNYDHRDYLKPLEVDAVCVGCNTHRGMAVNTFIDHADYWKQFDWAQPPSQTMHPYFQRKPKQESE